MRSLNRLEDGADEKETPGVKTTNKMETSNVVTQKRAETRLCETMVTPAIVAEKCLPSYAPIYSLF